jgi:hypothetical protein
MSSGHRHAHPQTPRFSLLSLSAGERLAGVAVLVAALWAAVAWAL